MHYHLVYIFVCIEELLLLAQLLNGKLERLASQAMFAEVKTNIVYSFIIFCHLVAIGKAEQNNPLLLQNPLTKL